MERATGLAERLEHLADLARAAAREPSPPPLDARRVIRRIRDADAARRKNPAPPRGMSWKTLCVLGGITALAAVVVLSAAFAAWRELHSSQNHFNACLDLVL